MMTFTEEAMGLTSLLCLRVMNGEQDKEGRASKTSSFCFHFLPNCSPFPLKGVIRSLLAGGLLLC